MLFLRLQKKCFANTTVLCESLSKSPRKMLITRKSLVVHEFPARVCWSGVLWVSVPSGVVGCGSVWLLHVSLCVYCISRLRFSDIGGMTEVDEQRVCIKFCVRLGKTESICLQHVNFNRHFSVANKIPPLCNDNLVFTGLDYEYLRKQQHFSFRCASC